MITRATFSAVRSSAWLGAVEIGACRRSHEKPGGEWAEFVNAAHKLFFISLLTMRKALRILSRMKDTKQIKFYRVAQYGTVREFVHPDSSGDGQIIQRLTGQKTIDGVIRELIRDLTGGMIQFVETVMPSK